MNALTITMVFLIETYFANGAKKIWDVIENDFQRCFGVISVGFYAINELSHFSYIKKSITLLNENFKIFLDELPLTDLNRIFYQ